MSRDNATLLDILEAGRHILEFTRGVDKMAFATDVRLRSAVLLQLLIIGEAVKRLSRSFRAEHPAIPWTAIAGMRDNLIHGYDIVDLNLVWTAVTHDVPELLAYLKPLVPEDQGE